jgi:hypothetical protein
MGEWLLSQRDGRTLALAGRRKNEVEGKQEVRRLRLTPNYGGQPLPGGNKFDFRPCRLSWRCQP